MRVLHLCSYSLYSGPIPGTVGLALAQRAAGLEVWLAHDRKRGAFNDFEEAATPRTEPLGLAPPVDLTLSTKSTVREGLRDLWRLRQLLRDGRVDVLHVHMSHDHAIGGILVGGPGGPSVVRTVHAERSLQRRFGQRWLRRRADAHVVRCAEHRRRLVDAFGVPPTDVEVIPGAVAAAAFGAVSAAEREAARARFGVPAHAPVVGHVALIAGRGQEELVEALVQVPRVHALFVGRGEREAALRHRVATLRLGDRVHFAGYLQGERELRRGYAACDVCFVAQAGNDATSRAALEAMACALPLVAVPVGALADLPLGECGYACQRSADGVAAALRVWLSDDGAAARGRRGQQTVRRERTFEIEAARTLALYARLRRTQ